MGSSVDRGEHVRHFSLGEGLPELTDLQAELDTMWDALLGRVDPPLNKGVGTLMEVAEAYHARACEVFAMIQRGEQDGTVLPKSSTYKFRTGELRTFIEAAKRAIEMGSRRITMASMEYEHVDFPSG